MRTFRWLPNLVVLAGCFTPVAISAATDDADPAANGGLCTINTTVVMPNGSPVAGAIVQSIGQWAGDRSKVQANESGQVQIRGVFGNLARIHASSPDNSFQSTLMVMAGEVRTAFAEPVVLKLAPAVGHDVTVESDGKPVVRATVAAQGNSFRVEGVTGPDGRVRLQLPAGEPWRELVALHPQLGVAGLRELDEKPRPPSTSLSLLDPAPHTIRVVDHDGKPVAGLELGVSVRTEDSDWIVSQFFDASHVQTDDRGEAIVEWAPREKLKYLDAEVLGTRWKTDDIDNEKIAAGISTVHVRQRMPVMGRIVMPGGASAEEILIKGFGFGPGGRGDIPTARARRDGTFTIDALSAHAYVLGVWDSRWAGKLWSGVILPKDSSKPADIEIEVYPATPLTIRVTRGENHEPIADAWLDVSHRGDMEWIDETGEEQSGNAGPRGWFRTAANGVAQGGVGKGEVEIRLSHGDWSEERKINVTSDEPIEVAFHRAWQGQRLVTAWLTQNGSSYRASPALVIHAWSERGESYMPVIHEPKIRDDGAIEVAFDVENLTLFVIDPEKGQSGFTRLGSDESSVEIAMYPNTTYSGMLLDENGKPLADRTLRILTESSRIEVVEPQRTDAAGRFHFTGVAVNVPLRVSIEDEPTLPEYYLFSGDRLFEPGEVREYDVLRPDRMDSLNRKPEATPLSERLASACANARVAGMRALVLIQGDDSGNVVRVATQLLNYDDAKSILHYLPVSLTAKQMETEATALAERQLTLPAEGEVVLAVFDGDQKPIATEHINARDAQDAIDAGIRFLELHKTASHNAMELWREACAQAQRDGRRVWLVQGGPRCGPCFRLARWIEQHRSQLEKDYVIVKAMGGIDEQVDELIQKFDRSGGGIPWHVITEPDGTMLITSEGPRGNIGMPSSVEDIRHLQSMLEKTARKLSPAEIDALVESLSDGR